jgi:hypothetical protein
MNATVTNVPLLLAFPTSNILDGPPPGSIAACHKAGWSQKGSFTQRFKHFVRFVKPSKKKDSVTLTPDGHYSYSKNIEVIENSGKRGAHCLPSPAQHS